MSTEIQSLQHQLGVRASGVWDAATSGAMLAYQQAGRGKYPMQPHGHPDPATLMNLGYYMPDDVFPDRWVDYLHGGEKPGTFMRDVGTAIDQVPRWAWATIAVSFGVFAYMAYRTDKKRGK